MVTLDIISVFSTISKNKSILPPDKEVTKNKLAMHYKQGWHIYIFITLKS